MYTGIYLCMCLYKYGVDVVHQHISVVWRRRVIGCMYIHCEFLWHWNRMPQTLKMTPQSVTLYGHHTHSHCTDTPSSHAILTLHPVMSHGHSAHSCHTDTPPIHIILTLGQPNSNRTIVKVSWYYPTRVRSWVWTQATNREFFFNQTLYWYVTHSHVTVHLTSILILNLHNLKVSEFAVSN